MPLTRALLPLWLTAAASLTAQPVIRYANILGGSGVDKPTAVTAGSDGSIYITGVTLSSDFPSAKRLSNSHNAVLGDAFVVKVDPTGAQITYAAIIGGGTPAAIALDSAGEVFVSGVQASADFPVTSGAASSTGDCFLFKLDAAGDNLAYSAKLTCSPGETLGGLAIDAGGNAYLAGSGQITPTAGVYQSTGYGPFAIKLNATGTAFGYATYLPGAGANSSFTNPAAIAIDAAGIAYITGSATASTFPATVTNLPHEQPNPADPYGITPDVFVVKLSPDGTAVAFATIFGGTGTDTGLAIAPDTNGNIYVTGASETTDGLSSEPFPTTPGVIDVTQGFPAGFLVKLNPAGDAFLFSTFLPEAQAGNCLSVQDAGVDVLTSELLPNQAVELPANRLMRVSLDGTALSWWPIVALFSGAYCGQGAGTFALAGDTGNYPTFPLITNSNLTAIGPVASDNVWFSAIAADQPGSAQLELSTQELLLDGIPAPDGSQLPLTETVAVTTGSQSAPLTVIKGQFVAATPTASVTPANVVITADQGSYTDRVIVFAPGVQDGLAIVSIEMSSFGIGLITQLAVGLGEAISLTGAPNGPPVSFTLLVAGIISVPFSNSSVPAPTNFTVTQPPGGFPSWLSVSPTSGTTPTQLQITANPAGLAAGFSESFTLQLNTPSNPLLSGSRGGSLSIPVYFAVTAPTATQPWIQANPGNLNLHVVSGATASGTVHLASTGSPLSFALDASSLPSWLSVTPASGTTPADLTVTVSPGQISAVTYQTANISLNAPSGSAIGYFQVTADEITSGYVGLLNAGPLLYRSGTSVPFLAPGGLFSLGLDGLLPAPSGPASANPDMLPTTLGGYSFKLNGEPVPLASYAGTVFAAQVPVDMTPGTYDLNGYDASGQLVATTQAQVFALAPCYIPNNGLAYAQKADGSTVTPANPVQAGDQILVTMTGQGAVSPALASGAAGSSSAPSVPLALVTATIAGVEAQVVSSTMSASQAGVLDVWLTVPATSAGDHYGSVSIGGSSAGTFYIAVATTPLAPVISAGGVSNSASFVPAVAPGSLFSIFGGGFAAAIGTASGFPLPTTIGQTSVTIGGMPAPLIYVSPGQINAQAPFELTPGAAAPVVVSVNGANSAQVTVPVVAAAPGIFQYGQSQAVVENQDYSLNGPGNGAVPGSYIMIYLTGSGAVDNPVATGAAASANPLSHVLGDVKATVDGIPAVVEFAGLTPGFAGLTQVNIAVPNLPAGTYFILVTIDGNLSNSAMLTVGP